ncbi:MAG: S1 RNA-binding domain-containing protein [Patescibacteria group bacterium]
MSILDRLAKEIDKISGKENELTATSSNIGSGEKVLPQKSSAKKKSSQIKTSEAASLMEELIGEDAIDFPEVGDVVQGKVIETSSNAIYLDIEPFGTGIVLGREIKDGMGSNKLKVGDKVSATITDLENDEGFIELSIREASYEKAWEDLESKRDTQEKIITKVVSANKGGLLVEVNGISGFLPVSQLSSKNYPRVEDGDKNKIFNLLKKMMGQEIEVRIMDVDKDTEKLIVSEKAAQKEKNREIISNLKEGDIVEGEISGVVDFGAFIKFLPPGAEEEMSEENKLEGLVHISELAWQLIENPRDIVKIGSKVKAKIIGIDDNKISLSLRALEKDPWSLVGEKYKVGDIVKGTVHKINHFGAFVYLDKDIHGLAHVSEMAELFPGKNMDELIKAGGEYDWKILSLEPKEHRMGLALADKKSPEKSKEKKGKESGKEEISEKIEADERPFELVKEKATKPEKEKPVKPIKEKTTKSRKEKAAPKVKAKKEQKEE